MYFTTQSQRELSELKLHAVIKIFNKILKLPVGCFAKFQIILVAHVSMASTTLWQMKKTQITQNFPTIPTAAATWDTPATQKKDSDRAHIIR